MEHEIIAVSEFHDAFGVNNADSPTLVKKEIGELRYKLMAEENDEYLEAVKNDNLVEIADALGDQLYILCGTILTHGMQHVIEKVFNEIHASNMSKLGPDGKPIYREDGKILKGENYFKPSIKDLL
jgi:predicted HAD superfamily Cof-like phosphohydrolase